MRFTGGVSATTRLFVLLLLALPFTHVRAATLTEVEDFGDNPGDIDMYQYVPDALPDNAPLVVALHGCKQNAETYSKVGWLALADAWQFALVFPQQSFTNNPYSCWNWFQAEDTERDAGEVRSIIAMVEKMKTEYRIDSARIYVDGLSAGGWMATNLLATYPDVFAGGATHAGGPAFCTRTERHFWDLFRWWNYYQANKTARACMAGEDISPADWRLRIEENGYNHAGPWPVLSIWQGLADEVVDKINQQELVDQWTAIHDTDQTPDLEVQLGVDVAITRREYHDSAGRPVVETWSIPGLAHGIAIVPGQTCGEEGDYILQADICAVRMIGHFWGLDN